MAKAKTTKSKDDVAAPAGAVGLWVAGQMVMLSLVLITTLLFFVVAFAVVSNSLPSPISPFAEPSQDSVIFDREGNQVEQFEPVFITPDEPIQVLPEISSSDDAEFCEELIEAGDKDLIEAFELDC